MEGEVSLDQTNRQHHCYCLIEMSHNRIAVQQHKLEAPYVADGTVKGADTLETRLAVPQNVQVAT